MASTKGEPRTQNTSKGRKSSGSANGPAGRSSSAGRTNASSGRTSAKNTRKTTTSGTSSKKTAARSSAAYQEEEEVRRGLVEALEENERNAAEEGLFPFFREICALLAFGFCVLMFLGNFGIAGKAGEILALIAHGLFGQIVSWVFPFALFAALVYIIYRWYERTTWIRISGLALVFVCLSTLFQVFATKKEELAALSYFEGITKTAGGFFGVLGTHLFMFFCGKTGAVIIVLILILIGILLMTGLSLPGLFSFVLESARDRREEEDSRRQEQRRRASLRENAAQERKKSSEGSDREGRDSRDYWESRNQQISQNARKTASSGEHETSGSPIQGYPPEMFASPETEKPKKKGRKQAAVTPQTEETSDTSGLNIFGLEPGKAISEPVPEEKTEPVGYGYGASFRKEEPAAEQTEENFPDDSMFRKPEEASKRPVYGSASRTTHPSYREPSTKDPSAVEMSASDGGIVVMSKQTKAAARRMSYEGPIFNEMEAFVQDMGKTDPDVVPPPPIRPQLKPKRDNRTLSELSSLDKDRGVDESGYEYGESATDAFARRHSLSGKTPVESSFATETVDASPIGEEEEDYPDLEATADLNGEDFAGGWMSLPEEYDENGTRTVVTSTGKRISHKSGFLPGERGLSSEGAEKLAGGSKAAEGGASSKPVTPAPSSVVSKKPEKKMPEYRFPPLDLLENAKGGRDNRKLEQTLRDTAANLEETLASFGVGAKVSNITCGPTVTRYELIPDQGVRVNKILQLTDDIKMKLAAEDIRIEAPIPGKSAIGIEVPNPEKMPVHLRELLESSSFRNNPSPLAFVVGKDIAGAGIIGDLGKMPHLLIAGSTGSGKSVCVNTMILSLLYHAKPSDVKMIMIDPKVVELSVYNGIPHLLIPVVTNPDQAAGALNWAVAEMDRRYNEFAKYGVRDLKGYNQKIDKEFAPKDPEKPAHMSYIVVIIDELADLMMVAPGEVEDAIIRLAQKARAAGIHLIIATQRPSVNVITGLIKANVPSRIAFAVASGTDSRTILDTVGAEKLLGKGDMLYFPSGLSKPLRVQGAFESDEEVSRVMDYIKNLGEVRGGEQEEINLNMTSSKMSLIDDGSGNQEYDELFVQAGRFVIEKEKASSGMLQRMFRIGFNRAARILEQLYDAGVVGEEEGTKPRKVLMTEEEFEQFISNL